MARIPAELVTPSVIHFSAFSFSLFGISVMERNTPMISAITGLPMKEKKDFTAPEPNGALGKSLTDFSAIRMIGRRIGEKLCSAPGSWPYFSISSSTVYSGFAGMSILLETLLAYTSAEATAGMETRRPTRIVSPRSASSVPAIAIGPGVGGTRQWVA